MAPDQKRYTVDFSKICPFLQRQLNNSYNQRVSIDPHTQTVSTMLCTHPTDEDPSTIRNTVYAEIVTDRMTPNPNDTIEITCKGCRDLANGFEKTVSRKRII